MDIGCNSRISDDGVLKKSFLNKALESNTLHIPQAMPLLTGDKPIPFIIVADDAFPLNTHILKPYSQVGFTPESRIFNYRLSCA